MFTGTQMANQVSNIAYYSSISLQLQGERLESTPIHNPEIVPSMNMFLVDTISQKAVSSHQVEDTGKTADVGSQSHASSNCVVALLPRTCATVNNRVR